MVKKQKLQLEPKNTPADAPQVCRSVSSSLNKVERPSASNIRLDCNNAEVVQRDRQPEQNRKVSVAKAQVFVLDANNTPLMPCSPRKARKLLKEDKATVVKSRPFFTIQLTKHCGGTKQPITLGIDTGYEFIGFALVGLHCYLVGQIRLDNKTSSRLKDRAMYRRNRRNRLRHRPARWLNRASHRNKDVPPSVQRRINRHIWIIEKLQSICPVINLVIEGAVFDIQKLNNPEIQGTGYQEGKLFRSNLRAYLFAREQGICQYCGKKIQKGARIEMHHIRHKSDGGTDKPDNFALLHDVCHRKMHDLSDFGKLKKNKQYKAETFMNILRKRLFERFPDAVETHGYITQENRKELGLLKEHYIDAFVIAGGTNQALPKPLKLAEHRKNNRSLQVQKKGKDRAIRRRRYPIQPGDLIWIGNKRYVSKGSTGYGKQVWVMKEGKKAGVSVSKITKVYHFGTIGFET